MPWVKAYMLKNWYTGSSFADATHALLIMGRQSTFLDLSFLAAFNQESACLRWAFWYLDRIAAIAFPNLGWQRDWDGKNTERVLPLENLVCSTLEKLIYQKNWKYTNKVYTKELSCDSFGFSSNHFLL